jgi:transcriptional regulator with XRE-family HTH domain
MSAIMVDFARLQQGQSSMAILPEQCRAARGLLNWTQARLAALAGVSRSTIKDFECNRHALHRSTEEQLIEAFDRGGIQLLFQDGSGSGVGVCLKAVRAGRARRDVGRAS